MKINSIFIVSALFAFAHFTSLAQEHGSEYLAPILDYTPQKITVNDLIWHDMADYPLHGTLAADASKAYSRLPDSLHAVVRPEVWNLGLNSAGLYIRFATDASAIGAKWRSLNKFNMNHMTATGIRGLDLYALDDSGHWTTVVAGRPSYHEHNTTAMLVTDMVPARMREYLLYLPLYDGVDSIYIGVDSAATMSQPVADSPRSRHTAPIVMYGTSILQGGCASRPGMTHTSILERLLDHEVVNLGFSGNAKLDEPIAHLIADTPAAVIVLDPLENLKTDELVARMPGFINIIRAKHPTTPILLVESELFPIMRFDAAARRVVTEKNAALRSIYEQRVADGDANLYYFDAAGIQDGCVDGTVDNHHMTDLGFTIFAQNLAPVVRKLLKK